MDLHNRNKRTLENGNECKRTIPGRGKEKEKERNIFQEDSLPLLLFVIAMILLNYILWKCNQRYRFTKLQEKVNCLIYVADLKTFIKKKEPDPLTQASKIFNKDVGMEFGIEKKCENADNQQGKKRNNRKN